jgi:hypothetical protein
MPNIQPREQRDLQREALDLRQYMTPEEQAELDKLLWLPEQERQRYRYDPPAFAREVLHMNLAPYQEEVLTKLIEQKRVSFRGPHGAGKSTIAAAAVLWFLGVFDECKVPTTASAWRQLIEFLWPEIHKWALKGDWWRIGIQMRPGKELMARRIAINANRVSFALSSNDEAKIEGAHSEAVLYVFDEAKTIPIGIWDAAEGALGTSEHAYALALSTPGDNSGRFWELQTKREKFPHWAVVYATLEACIKAGRIMKDWVEKLRISWGENSVMFKRRVLGQFAEDDGDSLIPLAWVEAAQERWYELNRQVKELMDEGVLYEEAEERVWGSLSHIGVDPARFGVDKTGWAFRYGRHIKEVERTDKEDTMETADRMVGHMQGNTAVAQVDTNGLGAGVYDRGHQLWKQKELRKPHEKKCPLVPINVSNATKARDKSGEMMFNRLRDWLWWNMRELLEAGEIALPPDDILAQDLTVSKWTTTSAGKVLVESKDEVRKRIDRSPDVGDAVIMAYAPDAPPYKPCIGFL